MIGILVKILGVEFMSLSILVFDLYFRTKDKTFFYLAIPYFLLSILFLIVRIEERPVKDKKRRINDHKRV